MSGSIPKHLCLAVVVAFLSPPGMFAQTPNLAEPRVKRVFHQVEMLVKRHYPQAVFHQNELWISFELETRAFMIHLPLKTGEWQDAREVRGPKMGGVMGSVEVRGGRYEGAAVLPQEFDHCYYSERVSQAYSQVCDRHLYCHLSIPKLGRNDSFIKEFHDFINSPNAIKGLCE